MTSNRLKQPQTLALLLWAKENPDRMKTGNIRDLTAEASEKLGFPLTEPNLRTAIKSLGIERPKRKAKAKAKAATKDDNLRQLAIGLLDLADRLNLHPSNIDEIEQIAGVSNQAQDELLLTERV